MPKLTSPALRIAGGWLLLWILACGDPEATGESRPGEGSPLGAGSTTADGDDARPTLEDIGILVTFGTLEPENGLASLLKPSDAAFAGDRVLILDTSPPWVRVFDREGRIVRGLVRQGEGPGEVTRPTSLSATKDGGFLLSHGRGVERFGPDGELVYSVRPEGTGAKGAVEWCGEVVIQVGRRPTRETPASDVLVRLGADRSLTDPVVPFDSVRFDTRSYHPWFVDAGDDGALLYTEEVDTYRLVEMGCGREVQRGIAIDSLGEGVRVTRRGDLLAVHRPRPPYPAGVARVGDRILWFARDRVASGHRFDSLTVVTAFESDGADAKRLTLEGWYQLFDADAEGHLLVGNSWTLGQNWTYPGTWGLLPAVHLVDGKALLRRIDAAASTSGPR